MFAAAVAALLLAGCDKGASYSSFELSTADFRGADGAKTHWAAQGLYWEDGDVVVINGNEHTINDGGSSWSTSGPKTNSIDGYFYVAYPSGPMSDDGTTVSGVDFSGGVVPLACKGKTNKLTLYPCCAVIKIVDSYTFMNFLDADDTPGVVKGDVLVSGSIDVADACVRGNDVINYSERFYPVDLGDYSGEGYNYFVIPMDGGVLRAKLSFDEWHVTEDVVELRAGYMYVINE